MRVRLAVPDVLDDQDRKGALDAALESVTRTVTGLVRAGEVPPAAGEIKSKRVVWKPEPPGDEHFDLPQTVIARKWGDCDDLAPWHAGSLRAAGIDPGARAIVKKSGPSRWHAVVRRSDGSIEDPSAHAGMYQYQRAHGVSGAGAVGAAAPMQPPMADDGRMCLAICPSRDRRHPYVWFARCDAPDHLEPWDWSAMSASTNPRLAVARAIKTMRHIAAGTLDPEDDARLAGMHDLVLGHDPEDVAEAMAHLMGDQVDVSGCMDDAEHTVGFFGNFFKNIAHAVTSPITSAAQFAMHPSLANAAHMFTDPVLSAIHAAQPLAHLAQPFAGAMRFIPGIGPVAATAVDFLNRPPSSVADFAKFAMHEAPGFIPGVGPLMQSADLLSQFMPGLANALPTGPGTLPGMNHPDIAQLMNAPRFLYEQGQVARPWGVHGPAVMRF